LRRAEQTAVLTMLRNGKNIEIDVELGRYPEP